MESGAEVTVSWGDCVLRRETLRRGERFVVGPSAKRADFVIRAEEYRVRVERSGRVVVEGSNARLRLTAGDRIRIAIGALTLGITAESDLPSRRPFAARDGLFDLAIAASVLLYFIGAVALVLSHLLGSRPSR